MLKPETVHWLHRALPQGGVSPRSGPRVERVG